MSITLKRIGELTGTSMATVSRVVRGTGRVSEQTRERILAVAEQFNYRPNMAARSMVNRSTQLIGVVLPMSASGPFSRIIGGVENAARKAGYSVVLCQTEDDKQVLVEHLKLLACRRVDGILFCPDQNSNKSLKCLEYLGPEEYRPPIVILQEPIEQDEYPSVTVDNYTGAKQLCNHLISHGHLDMGFLSISYSSLTVEERYNGYRAAMKEANHDPDRIKFTEVQFTANGLTADPWGYVDSEWLDELLNANPHWTVLAAGSDTLAIKIIHALGELGRRVPDDIAVVGFDDVDVSSFITPSLTTVRQPSTEVGEEACNLLLDIIEDQENKVDLTPVRIPCSLKIRQSCGCIKNDSSKMR